MKRSGLPKSIGRRLFKFAEMEEVLIDVENSMNNRPLLYQDEAFEQPVIIPNNPLRGRPLLSVEEDLQLIGDEAEVTKRMRLLQRNKRQLRQRFMNGYVHALEKWRQLVNHTNKK